MHIYDHEFLQFYTLAFLKHKIKNSMYKVCVPISFFFLLGFFFHSVISSVNWALLQNKKTFFFHLSFFFIVWFLWSIEFWIQKTIFFVLSEKFCFFLSEKKIIFFRFSDQKKLFFLDQKKNIFFVWPKIQFAEIPL